MQPVKRVPTDFLWSLPLLIALIMLSAMSLLSARARPLTLAEPEAFALSRARVATIDARGHRRPCPKQGRRFQCAKPGWSHVGWHDDVRVQGSPSRCIWAHPLDGRTISVTFPDVTLPAQTPVALATALDDRAVSGRGGAVSVEVRAGAHSWSTRHPDQRGWRTLRLDGLQASYEGPVDVRISARRTGRRHFCFRWEVPE